MCVCFINTQVLHTLSAGVVTEAGVSCVCEVNDRVIQTKRLTESHDAFVLVKLLERSR